MRPDPFLVSTAAYAERILVCRRADLAAFVPWRVGRTIVGRVHRERAPLLDGLPGFHCGPLGLCLDGQDFAARSRLLAETVDRLHHRGELRAPLGENYPVAGAPGGAPLLEIDRAAVTWFGVPAAGVHLNGFVIGEDGLRIWIAERARAKRTYPGHLDNMVAGGQSIGMSARQTLVKECAEEASIPRELAERAVPTGTIDYVQQEGKSLKVDSLACFDLELPASFVPAPHDGEVQGLSSMRVAEVAASLRGEGLWKPNSALVMLHFLLRFGALDRELPAVERWHLWQLLRGELP